jgi:hypothetical protein
MQEDMGMPIVCVWRKSNGFPEWRRSACGIDHHDPPGVPRTFEQRFDQSSSDALSAE